MDQGWRELIPHQETHVEGDHPGGIHNLKRNNPLLKPGANQLTQRRVPREPTTTPHDIEHPSSNSAKLCTRHGAERPIVEHMPRSHRPPEEAWDMA